MLAVVAQRLLELCYAQANTRRLLREGAREVEPSGASTPHRTAPMLRRI